MYLQNKYTTWYYNIVRSAQSRTCERNTRTEKHHIVPKSMGGDNSSENLVRLTAREHFVCHWLLTKMTKGENKTKMDYAFWRIVNTKNCPSRHKVTSRVYEQARNSVRKHLTGRKLSDSTKQKLREARAKQDNSHLKGRTITPEWREKLSNANKGKTRSEESRKKQSETLSGRKRSPEECAAISNGLKGRVFTPEWRQKISEAAKRRAQEKKNAKS